MSRHPGPPASRRGVAMLMALAALVLVLAGLTAGLTALHGARQAAWSSAVDDHLLAGLRQGERLAGAWLAGGGGQVVLPPGGGGILLVDDRFILASGEGRLSVVAYDGLAGIPAFLAERGSALRTALPVPMLELAVPPIDAAQAERSAFLLDSLELPEGVIRFPRGLPGRGRIWRAGAGGEPFADEIQPGGEPSLAEAIAFRSDGRINLNTAPEPLLRTAYVVLGLGGVDAVLEHRRLLQPSPAPGGASRGDRGLRLVAQSDRWQMLITVRWQDIHRSWWVDFAGGPPASTMVQRHDVGD